MRLMYYQIYLVGVHGETPTCSAGPPWNNVCLETVNSWINSDVTYQEQSITKDWDSQQRLLPVLLASMLVHEMSQLVVEEPQDPRLNVFSCLPINRRTCSALEACVHLSSQDV